MPGIVGGISDGGGLGRPVRRLATCVEELPTEQAETIFALWLGLAQVWVAASAMEGNEKETFLQEQFEAYHASCEEAFTITVMSSESITEVP